MAPSKKRSRAMPKQAASTRIEGIKQTYDRIRKPVPPPPKVLERDLRKRIEDLQRREAEEDSATDGR